MGRFTDFIDQRCYPQFTKNWDSSIFQSHIYRRLKPDFRILDLGAGAGRDANGAFQGIAASVHGIDPSPQVRKNLLLDKAVVGNGANLPYVRESFDLVFSRFVCEHLELPGEVFSEVSRVLRPRGLFFILTPNRHHYVAAIAQMTPLSFHRWVNRLRGRAPEHTFPTFHRANTMSKLRALGKDARLELIDGHLIEGRPEYLRINAITYLFGLAYERIVNATPLLQLFRSSIIAEFQKTRDGTK